MARPAAYDFDEVGFLDTIRAYRFPMHHTLFLAAARVIGEAAGDPYRGLVLLDAAVSALALVSAWWFLRVVVGPRTAVGMTARSPASGLSYGAMG